MVDWLIVNFRTLFRVSPQNAGEDATCFSACFVFGLVILILLNKDQQEVLGVCLVYDRLQAQPSFASFASSPTTSLPIVRSDPS